MISQDFILVFHIHYLMAVINAFDKINTIYMILHEASFRIHKEGQGVAEYISLITKNFEVQKSNVTVTIISQHFWLHLVLMRHSQIVCQFSHDSLIELNSLM